MKTRILSLILALSLLFIHHDHVAAAASPPAGSAQLVLANDGPPIFSNHGVDTTASLPLPNGPLPWSDLNILSTTDTHGWVRGHGKREPLYGADLGDLAAFKHHLAKQADERGSDLLFVDSGDQVDGNGFVDADTSGVKGRAARELLKLVGWDLTTPGNHELYNRTVALDVWSRFVPAFNGQYLASNINISLSLAESDSQPFGNRYHTFVTKNRKLKITSFGVMFAFDRPDKGLLVQRPEDMVKEAWWKEALENIETDVFIVVGHMATRDPDWKVVLRSIRAYHPSTPILIFSGHAHIRDCVRPDSDSQVLAAGRYLETLGFTSLTLPCPDNTHNPALPYISRRYLDTNLATYFYHSNTTQANFLTPTARRIKARLAAYSNSFNLSYTYGTAPQSYYLNRYPVSHHKSIINLYADKVFNTVLSPPEGREQIKPVFLFNTGAVRFDIFKGPFTRDAQLTVIPFENGLWYIPDLKKGVVSKVLDYLNNLPGEPELLSSLLSSVETKHAMVLKDSLAISATRAAEAQAFLAYKTDNQRESELERQRKLTYGYVTTDQCGPQPGDDTLHRPIPSFPIPDFVLSNTPKAVRAEEDDIVDLVFYEFISPLVLKALNDLQDEKVYKHEDVKVYSDLKANELLGEYARIAWN